MRDESDINNSESNSGDIDEWPDWESAPKRPRRRMRLFEDDLFESTYQPKPTWVSSVFKRGNSQLLRSDIARKWQSLPRGILVQRELPASNYLPAAMAAVVSSCPDVFNQRIKERSDGTCCIELQETSMLLDFVRAVEVVIPITRSKNVGSGSERTAIEAAFAKWKGGPQAIGFGGSPGAAMAALTGRRDKYIPLDGRDTPGAVFALLVSALDNHQAVCATLRQSINDSCNALVVHAVLGVREEHGMRYVNLTEGNDDFMRLDLAPFAQRCVGLYIS